MLQSAPSTSAAATEDSSSPTHAETTFLRRREIATLRDAEKARIWGRSLHQLAKETLNSIAAAGLESNIDRCLDAWFPWRQYVACHAMADDIIASGIAHAAGECIHGVKDANRGGQPPTDFVLQSGWHILPLAPRQHTK